MELHRQTPYEKILKGLKKSWQLYLLLLLPVIYIIVFHYWPMYGVQIAFKRFSSAKGIMGSPWVGMKHFIRFFESPFFNVTMINTVVLSLYGIIAGFPCPILLALALNATQYGRLKKVTQTFTYMPYFISVVVMVGIVIQFLSPRTGLVNQLIVFLGGEPVNFMGSAFWFRHIYVWSGIWQTMGWKSVIYLAALTSIDPQIYDAANVDGANRFKQMLHIDIPGVLPAATVMLVLSMGEILGVGFEKVFLMQNNLNLQTSEVLSTYIYKVGLAYAVPNFSYGSAIGLFNSVITFAIVLATNKAVRKMGGVGLW